LGGAREYRFAAFGHLIKPEQHRGFPRGLVRSNSTVAQARELLFPRTVNARHNMEIHMLRWAVIFLLIGLVAGLLGFTSLAGASIAIAKIIFFVFMVLFLAFLVAGLTVARRVTGG
jgi:uncharacterized membrane protein YtjA (UPF0391 family)